jgi:hypothetical protein
VLSSLQFTKEGIISYYKLPFLSCSGKAGRIVCCVVEIQVGKVGWRFARYSILELGTVSGGYFLPKLSIFSL